MDIRNKCISIDALKAAIVPACQNCSVGQQGGGMHDEGVGKIYKPTEGFAQFLTFCKN